MIPRSWLVLACVALAALAAICLLANRLRGQVDRCRMDGLEIASATRVEIDVANGRPQLFCSLACAERWLAASDQRPERIRVADEASGALVDAFAAHYVKSRVPAPRQRTEHRHAFASRKDALAHASSFEGRVLAGKEAPFARY